MPALAAFDYAVIRVVPRVEREEFINVGAVVFCPDREYICAKIELDEPRLRALFPEADIDLIQEHLDAFRRTCAGGEAGGPIGLLPTRERWHWLVAPKNTIIQTSAPHSGLCADPEQALERILDANVRPPRDAEQARHDAEQGRRSEQEARKEAEARVAALEAEIARLRGH